MSNLTNFCFKLWNSKFFTNKISLGKFFNLLPAINLPWGHASYKKKYLGLVCSAVLIFIEHKQNTDENVERDNDNIVKFIEFYRIGKVSTEV